jgi:hypothetical protein
MWIYQLSEVLSHSSLPLQCCANMVMGLLEAKIEGCSQILLQRWPMPMCQQGYMLASSSNAVDMTTRPDNHRRLHLQHPCGIVRHQCVYVSVTGYKWPARASRVLVSPSHCLYNSKELTVSNKLSSKSLPGLHV